MNRPPLTLAGYQPKRTAGDCRWNAKAAARVIDFFAELLTHPDDSPFTRAGDPFKLEPWQKNYLATLYGWQRPDGTRRYRESLAGIPRKNGKSTLLAGIALYELVAMGRHAAQIYSAAQTRDQASLVFSMAARMVRHNKYLADRLDVIDSTKRIVYKATGSFYRAIPADAGPVHGTKPAVVIFDELHTQKTRDLYDALKTGQGATVDPLFVSISTAGYDKHSICYDVWNTARQVRDGANDNPYFLPLLYEISEGEDWQKESTWRRVNPNLGKSITLDFLREEYQRATDSPAYENSFRNLYLNEWTEQHERWLSMDKWDACNGPLAPLAGRVCYVGLDLSTRKDLTAAVLVFPGDDGVYDVLPFFWCPSESIRTRSRQDRVPYDLWAKAGHMETTDGDTIDYSAIRAKLNTLRTKYDIQEVAIDPWNAQQLMTQLQDEDGFNVVEHRQGMASMSSPSKSLEALVLERRLRHAGHPVLRWNAANVAIRRDHAENFMPVKDKSTERIDGIVALTMAIGRAEVTAPFRSVYESRGLLTLAASDSAEHRDAADWSKVPDWKTPDWIDDEE